MKNNPLSNIVGYWQGHGEMYHVVHRPLESAEAVEVTCRDTFARARYHDNGALDLQPQPGRVFIAQANGSYSCEYFGGPDSGVATMIESLAGRSRFTQVRSSPQALSTLSAFRDWNGELRIQVNNVDRANAGKSFCQELVLPPTVPGLVAAPRFLPQIEDPEFSQSIVGVADAWFKTGEMPGGSHRQLSKKDQAFTLNQARNRIAYDDGLDGSLQDHNPLPARFEWPSANNHYASWRDVDGARTGFASIRKEYKESTFENIIDSPEKLSYLWIYRDHAEPWCSFRSWTVDKVNPAKSVYQDLTLAGSRNG